MALLAELPILVVWGSDDKTIPPQRHQAIANHLQHAHLVEITGAGHYLHETAPDRLLPAVHAFLASTTPFQYTETRWRDLLIQPSAPTSTST